MLSSLDFWAGIDSMPFHKALAGFTLIELLASISIFSVLGMGAYQMLQTVAASHERVRNSTQGYIQLNLALSIIGRDFNQFVSRPVRDEYGETLPPIVFENEDYIIEFTRGGWSNPAGRQRSRLQRVAYSVDYDEKTLTRHFWEVLDRAEDSEPVSQLLLEGVSDFRATGFMGEDSDTESEFQLEELGDASPLAIEIVISTDALGEIQRLFQLIEPYLEEGSAGGTPDQPGDRRIDDENRNAQ